VGFEGISGILSIPLVPPLGLVTTFVISGLPIMRIGGILITHPSPISAGGKNPLLSCRPLVTKSLSRAINKRLI
jgi:hypothetical protein